jgi:heptaprenyl diphosphate synthase
LELVSGPIDSDADLAEALTLLRASAGLAQARTTLDSYASTALAELGNLEPSASRDALVSLTHFVVARTR